MEYGGSNHPLSLRAQGQGSTSAQAQGACSAGSHRRLVVWVSSEEITGSGYFFPCAFGRGKARSEMPG